MGPSTLFQHKHATRVAGAAFAVVVVTIAAALFDGALVRNGKEAPGQHRRSLQVWDPKTVAPRTQADNYLRQPQESPDSVAASRMQYPETAQMGREQIDYILSVLPPDGNLLVWGLGNDSPYWNSYTSGKVMFLEDDIPHPKYGTLWYDEIMSKYPYLNAFKVHYTTNNDEENFERYMRDPWSDELILEDFPREVLDTAWDVILVDAPQGDRNHGPARYQAIYATLQLARNKLTSPIAGGSAVHIFIDDYERKVENEFSRRAFGGKEPVRVVTRPKGVSNANEQAHFILDSSDCVISDPMSCPESMQQLPQQLPEQYVAQVGSEQIENEYIVLLTSSEGFLDMLVNWLKFFERLAIPNLPVHLAAEDHTSYVKCLQLVENPEYLVDLTCLPVDFAFDHDAEKFQTGAVDYGADGYIDVVSRRPLVIQRELELGQNVIYSDLDVIWQKNPLPLIDQQLHDTSTSDEETHILAQQDYANKCTGFVVYKSCSTTINFVNLWGQVLKENPGFNQHPFNDLLRKSGRNQIDIKIRAEFLPPKLFTNGNIFFKKLTKEEQMAAVTVHNNYIKGYDEKIARFKEYGLWLVDE